MDYNTIKKIANDCHIKFSDKLLIIHDEDVD